MTDNFKNYVKSYKRATHKDKIDAVTEFTLVLKFVWYILAFEHVILYGDTEEFSPKQKDVVQAIREACGEDVYKRLFEGEENGK